MFAVIFFIGALFASLSSSVVWKPDVQNSFPWNESDLRKESYPENIILFLGQPTQSHDCKEKVNNPEPEYAGFSTVASVKSCFKGNAADSEYFSPKDFENHSDQQHCDYCEKALMLTTSDLLDVATDILHAPSGMITVSNFSIYNVNRGSTPKLYNFRGRHFQYRSGYDEEMNQTESEAEQESQTESDSLMYSFLKQAQAMQMALCKKVLQALGYLEPPLDTSEERYYFTDVPKLADLVHDMLRKFQYSQSNKGFVLVVKCGELQEHCGAEEAVDMKNALAVAVAETDPAATLVVATSSCPADTSEPFDITKAVYAQGPGSKELANAEYLWEIPEILSIIWQKDNRPIPEDSFEANSWNYENISQFSTQATDNVTNGDQQFATEDFNDQAEKNLIENEPEYQMTTPQKQNAEDGNLEVVFKNAVGTSHTARINNTGDEMNMEQNSDAQGALASAKMNFTSHIGSTKKEHKGKSLVTHLPGQHIEANANASFTKFAAFDNNETILQKHDVFMRNDETDIPHNISSLVEDRNSDKMLLNTEHVNNVTLLSSTAKSQNSKEGENTNILIRKLQINEEENSLGNKSLPNKVTSEPIAKKKKVSSHKRYPSSNIQPYREVLPNANHT